MSSLEMDDAVAGLVADQLAIRNLLAGLSHVADTGELTELSAYYTRDATWTTSKAQAEGLSAVVAAHQAARDAGVAGPAAGTRHMLSCVTVEVHEDRASAVARSYWTLAGARDGTLTILMMGEFSDELVPTPDGWRIARRVVRADEG